MWGSTTADGQNTNDDGVQSCGRKAQAELQAAAYDQANLAFASRHLAS
jgi:hypothetical protein